MGFLGSALGPILGQAAGSAAAGTAASAVAPAMTEAAMGFPAMAAKAAMPAVQRPLLGGLPDWAQKGLGAVANGLQHPQGGGPPPVAPQAPVQMPQMGNFQPTQFDPMMFLMGGGNALGRLGRP